MTTLHFNYALHARRAAAHTRSTSKADTARPEARLSGLPKPKVGNACPFKRSAIAFETSSETSEHPL